MPNVLIDDSPRIIDRFDLTDTNAITFDRAVVTLDLAVALRIVT